MCILLSRNVGRIPFPRTRFLSEVSVKNTLHISFHGNHYIPLNAMTLSVSLIVMCICTFLTAEPVFCICTYMQMAASLQRFGTESSHSPAIAMELSFLRLLLAATHVHSICLTLMYTQFVSWRAVAPVGTGVLCFVLFLQAEVQQGMVPLHATLAPLNKVGLYLRWLGCRSRAFAREILPCASFSVTSLHTPHPKTGKIKEGIFL